ncbi:DUF2628 domain-containing protein [Sediminicoccus rosea]|jgi:hypothetical protein|uniref:DUF2628 domain-containing protein n=1 Tax=Sediminicoccus rosea TaxID=1225128 RepID=A0ABZ0PK91_9PROT|nr:DUF2628 domain-containing protein [Sediminicoccus rosea]WPB85540.1 DUF2628 domain-containing protein [Sediminicoccus rosea]
MRSWTVHLPPGAARGSVPATGLKQPPVLIPEGFSFWAFLFGPFWLFRHRAWLAGFGVLVGLVVLNLLPDPYGIAAALAAHLLLGFQGQDLRRWALGRRGWTLAHVVQGQDADGALARLLQAEPRLLPLYAGEVAR